MSKALSLSLYSRNSRQNKASPLSPGKIVLHPMELPGPKTKTFLITPGNVNSYFNWPLEFPHYIFSTYPQQISSSYRVSHIGESMGGALPHPKIFFSKTLHQNWCPSMGHSPHLKMSPPPSKRKALFHEMILRKS